MWPLEHEGVELLIERGIWAVKSRCLFVKTPLELLQIVALFLINETEVCVIFYGQYRLVKRQAPYLY